MIYGEYDLIEIDDDFEQKICAKSAPTFNAEIAE